MLPRLRHAVSAHRLVWLLTSADVPAAEEAHFKLLGAPDAHRESPPSTLRTKVPQRRTSVENSSTGVLSPPFFPPADSDVGGLFL